MNQCESIRKSLGVWLDGELNPSDAEAVQAHVQSCSACREEMRQIEKLQSALKNTLASSASQIAFEPFWRGVQERMRAERSWHGELREWARITFSGPRLAWTVPAAILLLLTLFSLERYLPGWGFGPQRNNTAYVESIDAYGRNVALFREDETKTTVIWLYQNPEGEDESTGESDPEKPSF
ncbi:MAG TPA: zf-HC2 domain-containing protein [Candidatus Binatia bacterium]|nr:zf-HC2 domain-containing protein [Candidatus Binatia bacterium]